LSGYLDETTLTSWVKNSGAD